VFEGDARVSEYVGGYTDWLRQSKTSSRGGAGRASAAPAKPVTGVPASGPAAPAAPAAAPAVKARRLSYKDQRELDSLPERILALEAEQQGLQTALADPELFRQTPERAAESLRRLEVLARELESAYARWQSLEGGASA